MTLIVLTALTLISVKLSLLPSEEIVEDGTCMCQHHETADGLPDEQGIPYPLYIRYGECNGGEEHNNDDVPEDGVGHRLSRLPQCLHQR